MLLSLVDGARRRRASLFLASRLILCGTNLIAYDNVQHSLELAAGKGNSRELVIDLTINAVGAVVLVGGLWLVRQQLRADARVARGGGDTAPPADG